jgi:hypothetical protein
MAILRSAFEQRLSALGRVVCCRILTIQDKSTMNLFAIDSLEELREDKLG